MTIGRLFSLGNYEHVRYELQIDIPEGRSASTALKNAMRLFKAANPKPPIPKYDYEHCKSILSDPTAWHKNIVNRQERAKAVRELVKKSKATVSTYDAWLVRRRQAEQILDNIGATKEFREAKCDWEYDDWD